MTYSIEIWNSALSTDEPPSPWLTDSVPASTTVVHISDGGMSQTVAGTTIVSWTLPAISTGEGDIWRSYSVRVDEDAVSGTQIVNSDYWTYWHEEDITTTMWLSNTGVPFTTTVREVGLIDSFKEVTPTFALPGPDNVLTYYLHIVNTSAVSLTDVVVEDLLPWESSTYQRDAVASAGEVVSDIVSIHWTGDVDAFSSEVVTVTVLVDEDFEGPITNTAVISHAELREEVVVEAVAYITDEPVLEITKKASPDPVKRGNELTYQIRVINRGNLATNLVISDSIPADTSYVAGSASSPGELVGGDRVEWRIATLEPGESKTVSFRVTADGGREITNEFYGVTCFEGVTAVGVPVITEVSGGGGVYLPLVIR
jgi:uncharacterized repeat protein (TIGR01451 family)